MARGACNFRQTDVTRAVRAMRRAGFHHIRVVIEMGRAVVESADDQDTKIPAAACAAERNEWDDAEEAL